MIGFVVSLHSMMTIMISYSNLSLRLKLNSHLHTGIVFQIQVKINLQSTLFTMNSKGAHQKAVEC